METSDNLLKALKFEFEMDDKTKVLVKIADQRACNHDSSKLRITKKRYGRVKRIVCTCGKEYSYQ